MTSGAYVSLNSNAKSPSDTLQPAEGGMVRIPDMLLEEGPPGWPSTSHMDTFLQLLCIYCTYLPLDGFRQNRAVLRKTLKTTILHIKDKCNVFLDKVSLSSAVGV